jgi:molybdate transport system substrate-binding protein
MSSSNQLRLVSALWMLFCAGIGAEDGIAQQPQREMLIYCGITMVRPITEIARIFEKKEDVEIIISQGGSEDLYRSLKKTGQGDLYLPGEASYREAYLGEGLLGDYVNVGYNQAALVVAKGNPRQVKPDLNELLRGDLKISIGSPESGSIGYHTRKVLQSVGIYDKVVEKAVFLEGDSRNLNGALRRGEVDLILNWRATAFFPDNIERMEVIDLDPHLAKLEPLLLTVLNFSKYPDLARRFMEDAASPEGQAIFRKYGFTDNQGVVQQ